MTFKEYKPGERPDVLFKTCPVCGKVVTSLYPKQLAQNFTVHLLTHKGVGERVDRKSGKRYLKLPIGDLEPCNPGVDDRLNP